MNSERFLGALVLAASVACGALALGACDTETATSGVVDNLYATGVDGGDAGTPTVVYRVWWVATYFPDPVSASQSSAGQRAVPASDFAYAVLAPGWDPASGTPPARLLAAKSKQPLSVSRGATLHIGVDDQTFSGNCFAGQPLTQEDADLVTQRIFPGEFAGVTYDARTCRTTPIPDGGVDAANGAPGGASADAPNGG